MAAVVVAAGSQCTRNRNWDKVRLAWLALVLESSTEGESMTRIGLSAIAASTAIVIGTGLVVLGCDSRSGRFIPPPSAVPAPAPPPVLASIVPDRGPLAGSTALTLSVSTPPGQHVICSCCSRAALRRGFGWISAEFWHRTGYLSRAAQSIFWFGIYVLWLCAGETCYMPLRSRSP